jgi:aspartyl-tRNA synthetase
MVEPLGTLARTHTCGALRVGDVGSDVVLLGWVQRVRDLGALVFVDLRDRHGHTQVIVRDDEGLVAVAKRLRTEFVVGILGRVDRRGPEAVNPKMDTGEIEVAAREIRVLSEAQTTPFPIVDDPHASEETRLKYRYLDLRRPPMQRNLLVRHRVALAIRQYLDRQGFVEIETPILAKSTPEGARDFLVPSRMHPGSFYALPQSPQIFKQLLMIAGMDRYFQIVKCFRDEALRADRQLEFTQVDIEISFATRELVFAIVEGLIVEACRAAGVEVAAPFRRVPYAEAIARYGSDKPDLRFGMTIEDVSDAFRDSTFGLFRDAIGGGGVVRGFVVTGGARYSRRELDELAEQAKQSGLGGLVWARLAEDGAAQSSALKAAGEATIRRALELARAGNGDLLLMAAGAAEATSRALGALRLIVAGRAGLLEANQFALEWVIDFPLFEWNADEGRWDSVQHPFTAPVDEDAASLGSDPGCVRGKIYDLVLNGWEIGGGSIRIHDSDQQSQIFRLLNISDEEAKARFGFFVEALRYGTPPHGGIALGLDRIVAILARQDSIRDVIAFPKTTAALDLMADAPSDVQPKQLEELHIKVVASKTTSGPR